MKPQVGLESDVLLLLQGPTTINITARPRRGAGCPKVSAPPAYGGKMSLDIPFYRTSGPSRHTQKLIAIPETKEMA